MITFRCSVAATAVLAASGLALATAAFAASPPKPKPHPAPAPVKVAPADEYFGRMKMSILGISNSIRDTGTREGFDPVGASRYYSSLAMTQDALQDWARKYPHDTWIPRRAYDMSHDFWRMHTSDGDAAANRCRALLFAQFPHDHWTSVARSESSASVAPVATVASQTPAPAAQQQQQHAP